MRAPPPQQVAIDRFGWWRGGVVCLAALAAASWLGWVCQLVSAAGPSPSPWAGLAVGLGGLPLLAAWWLARQAQPLSLRWDGAVWHLGPLATAGAEPWQGRLLVSLDLGAWMLLKLEPLGARMPWQCHWIPLQKTGFGSRWHLLRCAVYAPASQVLGAVDPAATVAEHERS